MVMWSNSNVSNRRLRNLIRFGVRRRVWSRLSDSGVDHEDISRPHQLS